MYWGPEKPFCVEDTKSYIYTEAKSNHLTPRCACMVWSNNHDHGSEERQGRLQRDCRGLPCNISHVREAVKTREFSCHPRQLILAGLQSDVHIVILGTVNSFLVECIVIYMTWVPSVEYMGGGGGCVLLKHSSFSYGIMCGVHTIQVHPLGDV